MTKLMKSWRRNKPKNTPGFPGRKWRRSALKRRSWTAKDSLRTSSGVRRISRTAQRGSARNARPEKIERPRRGNRIEDTNHSTERGATIDIEVRVTKADRGEVKIIGEARQTMLDTANEGERGG